MPSQEPNITTSGQHEANGQRLTAATLSAHDTLTIISPSRPTPMQRWFTSNDRIVRDRQTDNWEDLVERDALAAEIERIVQDTSKAKGQDEKWYVFFHRADAFCRPKWRLTRL